MYEYIVGVEVYLHILNLSTRRQAVSFMPWPLYHQGKTSSSYWMDPRAGIDMVAKRKNLFPTHARNRTMVVIQPVV
jgi:hypothetical protein